MEEKKVSWEKSIDVFLKEIENLKKNLLSVSSVYGITPEDIYRITWKNISIKNYLVYNPKNALQGVIHVFNKKEIKELILILSSSFDFISFIESENKIYIKVFDTLKMESFFKKRMEIAELNLFNKIKRQRQEIRAGITGDNKKGLLSTEEKSFLFHYLDEVISKFK